MRATCSLAAFSCVFKKMLGFSLALRTRENTFVDSKIVPRFVPSFSYLSRSADPPFSGLRLFHCRGFRARDLVHNNVPQTSDPEVCATIYDSQNSIC